MLMRATLAIWWLIGGAAATAAERPVSFRTDVMAVLAKAGCNQGTCHGNARGKGGFQLSLRGQDPANDFLVLTRDWLGRRANPSVPEQSLLLLKATMQVPHEGGRRFTVDSPEYAILRDWIARGLPADGPRAPQLVGLDVAPTEILRTAPDWKVALTVRARFSDGTTRNVSSAAVYETGNQQLEVSYDGEVRGLAATETVVLVRYLDQQVAVRVIFIPQRPAVAEFPPVVNFIDEHVFDKLRRLHLPPAATCDDATFVRRSTLDVIGTLPTADEAQRFLADPAPDKRTQWVEALLERPEFAEWWALKWADMLRLEEKTLDRKGAQVFHAWLRQAFTEDRPLDQLVHELVSAQGSTYEDPPANFYRALRDPFTRGEAVGQLFLGVRLQCAKCHNHPFDRWSQDDYYGWASVFGSIDYKILENRRTDTNDKHEFDGEQVVFLNPTETAVDPRTGKPRAARWLGAESKAPKSADPLVAFGDWLTRPDHDRFTQTLVNRVWRHLMGRGIVEPVDDFRATNPPSHPELLQSLANHFRSNGTRLKPLVRTIVLSQTYQRSSEANDLNRDDETNYAVAIVRRLTAEQLADGVAQATGVPFEYAEIPVPTRAIAVPGVGAMLRRRGKPTVGDETLRLFGRPQRLQSCECERSDETTLAQAFWFLSGPLAQKMTTDPGNRAARLSKHPPEEAIRTLYWHALARPPANEELRDLTAYVTKQSDRTAALQDVLWAIVSSPEFVFRR